MGNSIKSLNWIETTWKPKDALIGKNDKTAWLYTGQNFDEDLVELIKNGWTHDHCDICSTDIGEMDNCATSGNQIICVACYNDFIKT